MNPELPLRDIHLPAPIGWWPPAPGWYAVLAAVVLLAALSWWAWRRWRRLTVKKLMVRQLDALAGSAVSQTEKLRQLALLLRRASLSAYPREEVAGLTGVAWLKFLDRQLGDRRFSEGAGRLLLDAPYRREPEVDLDALLTLCREWAQRLPVTTIARASRQA